MFKRAQGKDDAAELKRLRELVERAGGESAQQVLDALDDVRRENRRLDAELRERRLELEKLTWQVVETRDAAILQEVGIFETSHPAESSVELREELAELKADIKEAVKDGLAVASATTFTLNGSAAQGERMVRDFSKLMLRAYNAECEALVRTMRPHRLARSIERLEKTRSTIARLGRLMEIEVSDYFHGLRVDELQLVAYFMVKKDEEKERARDERQRLREEAKALAEMRREEERLAKERDHRRSVLEQLIASGASEEDLARARGALEEVEDALNGIIAREANIRAGYVYVISNVGSHGPGIIKIGMTRRLDPIDRVRELSNAAVPFRFDVHALFFAEDALGLEQELHAHFADRRVNLVNFRREYFYATPEEVEAVLREKHGQLLEFQAEPEAIEWRQSANAHKEMETDPELRARMREAALAAARERAARIELADDDEWDPNSQEEDDDGEEDLTLPDDETLQDVLDRFLAQD